MKKYFVALMMTFLCAPLTWAANSNFAGTYICENDFVLGTVEIVDQGIVDGMSVRLERKDSGLVDEYSGAATKIVLGEKNITVYGINNKQIWFHEDGSIEYNRSIKCTGPN